MYTKIKTKDEIRAMRKAGGICARILNLMSHSVQAGMTTKELALIAESEIIKAGAKASFLNYNGFPEAVCISLNDEVVHGIPSSKRIIKNDDIISFDLGVTWQEMIVDSAVSIIVGQASEQKLELLSDTKKSLMAGLKKVKNDCYVGDISSEIQTVLDEGKYGIVRDLVGHGVGHNVHEEPNIPNFGSRHTGSRLKSGMTIAVEPMATLGGDSVYIDSDGWTVKTKDGSASAHFEHTILITDKGCEILTSV